MKLSRNYQCFPYFTYYWRGFYHYSVLILRRFIVIVLVLQRSHKINKPSRSEALSIFSLNVRKLQATVSWLYVVKSHKLRKRRQIKQTTVCKDRNMKSVQASWAAISPATQLPSSNGRSRAPHEALSRRVMPISLFLLLRRSSSLFFSNPVKGISLESEKRT